MGRIDRKLANWTMIKITMTESLVYYLYEWVGDKASQEASLIC